ncbi:MAG: GNAT family N-acetyltransferase [Thiomargarita sp.]|nr:GNAT family N-acetyltransferase [Thiomargarita sp.]
MNLNPKLLDILKQLLVMILSNQGQSLVIRQAGANDAPILLRAYEDETFINLYRSNNEKQTEEQLREILRQRQQNSPAKMGYLEFIIEHKRYGAVGIAALGDYSPIHQRAEYLIGLFDKQHRHLGYGIEATLLVLDLAFNTYRLNKLYSYVYAYNQFSQKNMIHLGFENEGILKQHHYSIKTDKFIDLYVNAMTVGQFRCCQQIQRISPRLLGWDITQVAQQVVKIDSSHKVKHDMAEELLAKLRALSS